MLVCECAFVNYVEKNYTLYMYMYMFIDDVYTCNTRVEEVKVYFVVLVQYILLTKSKLVKLVPYYQSGSVIVRRSLCPSRP